ncbi:Hypothetical protein, putative [Bodo saltans]|uniref:Uncharacterized protein n=1 Tax=Bodo saltans TaxID=75058 RepID=A0A0S4JKS3_BODSA|nr:Hypothetical protein, putative [Bodo saltans]|eukprot:CUG89068.1 Hypothetical protein, putative [Bodo saltans]
MSSTHSRGSSVDFRSDAVESRSEVAFAPTGTEGSLRLQPDSTIHFDDDSRVGEVASSSDGTPRSPQFMSEKEDVAPRASEENARRGSSAESFSRSDAAKNISASPPPRSLAPPLEQQEPPQVAADVGSPSPSREDIRISGAERLSPRSEHSIAISGTEASVNFFHDDDDDDDDDDHSMVLSPLRTPPPQPPKVLSPGTPSNTVIGPSAAVPVPPEVATPKPAPPSRRPPSTKPLSPGSPQRDIVVKAPPATIPDAPTTPLTSRRAASTPAHDVPKSPAIRQAEHVQTWDSSSSTKPHHAMYQPSQVQQLEEEEFAKNFPYWNKPKGAASVRLAGGVSSDGEAKPSTSRSAPQQVEGSDPSGDDLGGATAADTKVAVHSVDDLRSKAKEFSDKLRREHREANRTETSINSSTTFHNHQDSSIAFEVVDSINAGPPHDAEDPAEGALAQSQTSRRSGSGRRASPERQESVQSWLHGVAVDDDQHHHANSNIKNSAATTSTPPTDELEQRRRGSHSKSSFQEYAEVNLSPRSSNSGEERPHVVSSTVTVKTHTERLATAAQRNDAKHMSNAVRTTTPRRTTQPASAEQQRRPSTPGRQSTPIRRASLASSQPQELPSSNPHTVEQLEARRRKFYLIYGQRKGQELFERFLGEHNLQDHNPPQKGRRGSAPRSTTPTPLSRRPSPAGVPQPDTANPRETTPARRSAWDRLYRTQIHHPTHSPTREALHLPSPTDPRSSSQSAGRQRATTPPDPKVFTKLYQIGLDEKSRRQKLFLEGQRKKEEKELSEAVDAVILAKVLRSTAGHKSMTKADLEALLARERQKYLDSILSQPSKSGERPTSQPASRSGTPGSQAGGGGSRPPTPRSRLASPVRISSYELNLSAEPQLTRDNIDEMTNRLFKLGRRKFAEEEKKKADKELAGCTFTPRINGSSTPLRRASTPNTRSGSAGGRSTGVATEQVHRPANRSATPDRCKALYSYSQREKSNHDVNRERVIREQKLKILKSKLESDHHFKSRVAANPALAEKFMASITCV